VKWLAQDCSLDKLRDWTSFFFPSDPRIGLGSQLKKSGRSTNQHWRTNCIPTGSLWVWGREGTAPEEGYRQRPGSPGLSRRQWCQEGGKRTWRQWIRRQARPREQPHHCPVAPSLAPCRRKRSAATAGRPPSWPTAPASGNDVTWAEPDDHVTHSFREHAHRCFPLPAQWAEPPAPLPSLVVCCVDCDLLAVAAWAKTLKSWTLNL
jgi:hypothetical protein